MKRSQLLALALCCAACQSPHPSRVAPVDATCQRLSEAADEVQVVSGSITRGVFRLGQALGRCPEAAADAIAQGLWEARGEPASRRFRFWYEMARHPVDSAVFSQAVRLFSDTAAVTLTRAAGLQLAFAMGERATTPNRRTPAWQEMPDLASCLFPMSGGGGPVLHGAARAIRPLVGAQIRQRDSVWGAVRSDPSTPGELRRWLGTC